MTPRASGTGRRTVSVRGQVSPSSRYTPPVPASVKHTPRWLPAVMIALFTVGALMIMARYLLNDAVGNWLVFTGLGFVLVGLFAATRWR